MIPVQKRRNQAAVRRKKTEKKVRKMKQRIIPVSRFHQYCRHQKYFCLVNTALLQRLKEMQKAMDRITVRPVIHGTAVLTATRQELQQDISLHLNKMYQSLVRFGKEIMMVKNEYLRLFGGFKKSYPRSYERRIADYLNRFERTVLSNSLVQINILVCFREGDDDMQEMFPEIYEIYDETCFRKLNDSDITAICKSYVNKVREIGGEFIDAVKKVS